LKKARAVITSRKIVNNMLSLKWDFIDKSSKFKPELAICVKFENDRVAIRIQHILYVNQIILNYEYISLYKI